ncbi:2-acylglycerol O-acyltransferase 2 isoform X2 [Leopardus geoffroyi]|uniref:2-acylglycerol O-acyltransferase 2 isoform X2 n=1 Tax=Leopardus geoffroyi TaxID=46844 RepID=UPI001E2635D0|nr:2-acylglycerol O-acyltransferase 2 isoform X2 [Leopardus geoffroyi]
MDSANSLPIRKQKEPSPGRVSGMRLGRGCGLEGEGLRVRPAMQRTSLGLAAFGKGPDLCCRLRGPPVHQILVVQCPVCDLVVPGPRKATAGGQVLPSNKALLLVEVHEGLFPCLGLVTSDKESAAHILNRKEGGNLLAIIIGGAQEALNARPGAYTLLLRNRKGFVRLALMHGAALVPIFSFGENELFDQVENSPGSWLRCIQDRLQKIMGISLPLFHGRGVFQYSFGLIPYRQPITTVVGKPIEVQKTPHPSQEEVDKLHRRYIKELCDLFEAHKLKYNVPVDQHLEFC